MTLSVKIRHVILGEDNADVHISVNGFEGDEGIIMPNKEALQIVPFVGHTFNLELPVPESVHAS